MKGGRKESLSDRGKGCRAGAPSFPELQKNCWTNKHLQLKYVPPKQVA